MNKYKPSNMELVVVTIEWKPIIIDNIHTMYIVSNCGDVWSMYTNQRLTYHIINGYKTVALYINANMKMFKVHRLVAMAFIENSNSLPCVNHKDGNKLNNILSNLEWVTVSDNNRHAIDVLKIRKSVTSVDQYSSDGTQKLAHFPSIKDAAEVTKVDQANIVGVCKGRYKTAGGFVWKYVDKKNDKIQRPVGLQLEQFTNYIITEDGKIYSLNNNKYMKSYINDSGYELVSLSQNGKKKNCYIHILVASLFVLNMDPINKLWVNHIDNNPRNNNYINLEWVTRSENINHAYQQGGLNKRLKGVIQYDLSYNEINRFQSATEASKILNVTRANINSVCKGERNHAGGFKWKFIV